MAGRPRDEGFSGRACASAPGPPPAARARGSRAARAARPARAPARACSGDAPGRRLRERRAARGQAGDDAGEHVARARGRRGRRCAPSWRQQSAVGRRDVGRRALQRDDRVPARAPPRARARSGSALIVFLGDAGQVRHLAGVRRQQRRPLEAAHVERRRPSPARRGRRRRARSAGSRRRDEGARRRARPAGRGRSARASTLVEQRLELRQRRRRRGRRASVSGSAMHARLGQRERERRRDARGASRPPACRRRRAAPPSPASSAAPGISRLPAIDQHAAALFLVAVAVGLRQRPARAAARVDRRRSRAIVGHHDFGAAGTSGSAVTGAPASRSGATKFTSRRHELAVPAGAPDRTRTR